MKFSMLSLSPTPSCLLSLSLLALSLLTNEINAADTSNCDWTWDEVVEAERDVTNTNVQRNYCLAAPALIEIGNMDLNYNVLGFGKSHPMPLRPNMKLTCGDENDDPQNRICFVNGGDVHMEATSIFGIDDDSVDNVVIEGFEFIGTRRFSIWATKPGSITFVNCIWRDMVRAIVPVLLDYFDPNDTDNRLTAAFNNCQFTNNRYYGAGANTALIYSNGGQNAIDISRTVFSGNDMVFNNTISSTNSFLVESLGPVNVEHSCFENNQVGVSNIAVFGNMFSSNSIYLENSPGPLCRFASVFENVLQLDAQRPLCVDALSSICTSVETPAPTESPTASPSLAPSSGPTSAPTSTPSAEPSSAPTSTPSAEPTAAPSATPSLQPTAGVVPTMPTAPTQPTQPTAPTTPTAPTMPVAIISDPPSATPPTDTMSEPPSATAPSTPTQPTAPTAAPPSTPTQPTAPDGLDRGFPPSGSFSISSMGLSFLCGFATLALVLLL